MFHADVAIAGAGPAGSTAALVLARQGFSVLLLDKASFPRKKLCGGRRTVCVEPRPLGAKSVRLGNGFAKICVRRLPYPLPSAQRSARPYAGTGKRDGR